MLFCLALDAPLKGVHSEFVSGYLDDVGIGDTVPNLINQIRYVESAASSIGLHLNHTKCEIIGLSQSQRSAWDNSGLNFLIRSTEDAWLLGAPLSLNGANVALSQSCDLLERVRERLLKNFSILIKNSYKLMLVYAKS